MADGGASGQGAFSPRLNLESLDLAGSTSGRTTLKPPVIFEIPSEMRGLEMPPSPDGALTSASSPRTIDRWLWETLGPPGTEPPQQPPGRGKRRRPGHWGSFRLSREVVTQQSSPDPSGTPGGVSCTASRCRKKAELASVLCWVSMSHRLFPQRGSLSVPRGPFSIPRVLMSSSQQTLRGLEGRTVCGLRNVANSRRTRHIFQQIE